MQNLVVTMESNMKPATFAYIGGAGEVQLEELMISST